MDGEGKQFRDAAERETKAGQVASDGATCKQQEKELDKLQNKNRENFSKTTTQRESNKCIESKPHRTQIEARRQATSSSSTPRRPGDIQNRRRQSLPQFQGGWGAHRARMANVEAGRNVVCVRHFVYRLATSTRLRTHTHTLTNTLA